MEGFGNMMGWRVDRAEGGFGGRPQQCVTTYFNER